MAWVIGALPLRDPSDNDHKVREANERDKERLRKCRNAGKDPHAGPPRVRLANDDVLGCAVGSEPSNPWSDS